MIVARKILSIVDETDVWVPIQVRSAVEAQEQNRDLGEGDPIALLDLLTTTRPFVNARVRVVAAKGTVI